jgi:hypothetical protein
MSVATRGTARRWGLALVGLLAVGLAPPAWARLPADESSLSPQQLVTRARHSGGVAHSGLVESTGTLGLPDLPRLGDVAALLGGTTRSRVWWRSPQSWRVDRITPTGESGTYAIPGGVSTWDFESGAVDQDIDVSAVRLPRVDDLLPPQAARRALAGVTRRDRLAPLPARRVAGRPADGVRITPTGGSSTVGHLDLYVDEDTGLPLSLLVVPRGSSDPALRTSFVQVSFGRPSTGAVRPRVPPFARVRTSVTPDLAAAVDRYAPFALPETLAGSDRSADLVGGGGTATYGEGLARFVVLPLWSRLGRSASDAAVAGGGSPVDVGSQGEAVLVGTPLLNAVVVLDGDGRRSRSYLIAGTVVPDVLQAAARGLLDRPPTFR